VVIVGARGAWCRIWPGKCLKSQEKDLLDVFRPKLWAKILWSGGQLPQGCGFRLNALGKRRRLDALMQNGFLTE
jgi:hypothetical protein